MKKYFVFIVLTCLLGNRALAQNQTTYTIKTEVKETIDFTGLPKSGDRPSATIQYGDNYTITGISLNNGENRTFTTGYPISISGKSFTTLQTSANGNLPFNDWGSTCTIAASEFGNAQVGDIIRVNIIDKTSDYNPLFKYVGNGWVNLDCLQDTKIDGDGYFQGTINQEALEEITANGLRLQGLGFTMTSVELIGQATNAYPGNTWQLYSSSTHNGETYLQKHGENKDYFSIANLQAGDEVTIWGDNGNSGNDGNNAGCRVTSGNTDRGDIAFSKTNHNEGQVIRMLSDGTLELEFFARYAGVRKIEITRNEDQVTTFDYDPGYEEYDMYDEFSWDKNEILATTYSNSGLAGFLLNGENANYVEFKNSKITTNNRIALTGEANEWTFDFGLVPPGNNGDYSYFSICNLREGDRVVISYINDNSENPLIFASGEENGEFYYNGCAAFKDNSRDGIFDKGELYINNGYVAPVDWHRGEGNVGSTDNGWGTSYTPELCYTNSYVITEDGHLDLAFRRFVENYGDNADPKKIVSRIVKIKIFSDHQAMMVDEYDANSYWAKFNIPGELQAKEHIMPGGLEIQVGNDDATQHALVVSSKDGPVSYVNAVDGFKIPGVSKNGSQISINFNLGINGDVTKLPTTGTFYKFIPEVNGKMKFKFEAKSMNYYRWDLKGNGVYQNTSLGGSWGELFDRPNEQTVDASCPYYLVTVENGQITKVQQLQKENQQGVLEDIYNGGDYETPDYIDVEVGEEYYLFGGWNQSDLYYNSSWTVPGNPDYNSDASSKQYNNIEFRPSDGRTVGCGIAQLLWVEFDPDKKIYPLAKWVPNGTAAVYKKDENDKSGVPNPDAISYDTDKLEYELADLYGYTDKTSITVKKMTGNISECNPYLQRVPTEEGEAEHFKLMIDGIGFIDGSDKGGTILIKIGDATDKTSPVYTLTIAYSGDPQFDGNSGAGTRGHIWDYSSSSLHGWHYAPTLDSYKEPEHIAVYTHNAAEPEDYGHYFQNYFAADISGYSSADAVITGLAQSASGKLHDEINSGTSEWMFNYNLVNDGKLYDPVFTNKYDLEADNADLIWETEGTVIKTSANASVMFNEFTGDVSQSSEDPDRYVGILKGGEFRIPWLMHNDRVIIYMGTGKGAFNDHAVFNIRGAYDAVHKAIDPEDDYIVGGSLWNGDEKGYKGCYHFFAQGQLDASGKPVLDASGKPRPADMVFKMKTGSMCKIYKIQIYRGDRIITNEIVGKTEDDNKYFLWSRAADPNDESTANYLDENHYNWKLKYLGKDQQLANGTGKNTQENEIIAQTGKYNSTPALTNNRVDPEDNTSKVESFTYKHSLGEIGTFRVRGKDMEKNMNYVADYADHNVTIAYQQTQPYPYTWDFTDVTGIESNVTDYFDQEEKLGEGDTAPAGSGLTDDVWNSLDAESYQKTARDLSLWEVFGTAGNYFLRLNSQTSQTPQNLMERDNIFESAKEIGGNQVWANKTIVPEMKGLWFYTENYDPETHKSYDNLQSNGEWIIKQGDADNPGGLEFKKGNCDWFNKIVVPNVPNNAAVYMRMRKLTTTPAKVRYMFGQQVSMSELPKNTTSTSGTTRTTETLYSIGNGDYIVAIMNTTGSKSNLTLSLDGFRVQKLAVSTDPKQIGKTGYTTESRKHQIDHTLTAELTGKPIKAYTATYAGTAAAPDYKTMVLTEISNKTRHNMEAATSNGGFTGCILYNDVTDDDKSVSILDGGFHLFVPDMHDGYGDNTQDVLLVSDDNKPLNVLKAFLPQDNYFTYYTTMSQVTSLGQDHFLLPDEGSDKTLILSARKYKYGTDPADPDNVTELTEVSFVRVDPNGFGGKGAFLNKCSAYIVMPADQMKVLNSTNGAKVNVVFESDLFDMNDGIATGVTTIPAENASDTDTYYTLSGMKINRPTQSGLYIKNGKKVYVK